MGNIYNVEQKSKPTDVAGTDQASEDGLKVWKQEVRKQIAEKLKGYAPEKIEEIIKKTFSDSYYS